MKILKSLAFVIALSALTWGCSEPSAPPVTPDTPVVTEEPVVEVEPSPEPSPAPAPVPEPAPAPTPAPQPSTPKEWWQQRPFDPQWIVDTIAAKWDVTSEPTDVEHLRDRRNDTDRKAYIDYLEVQYKSRGGRSEN